MDPLLEDTIEQPILSQLKDMLWRRRDSGTAAAVLDGDLETEKSAQFVRAVVLGNDAVMRLLIQEGLCLCDDEMHELGLNSVLTIAGAPCGPPPYSTLGILLAQRALNINHIGKAGEFSPLQMHTLNNHIPAIRTLLAQPGLRINQTNRAGNTAMHLAARHQRTDIVKLLLQHPGIDLTAANRAGDTVFQTTDPRILLMVVQHARQNQVNYVSRGCDR